MKKKSNPPHGDKSNSKDAVKRVPAASHTPGPLDAMRVFINNAPDEFHVMTGKWGVDGQGRLAGPKTVAVCAKEADAVLFSAAPDLLELAREYLSLLESDYTGEFGKDLSNGRIRKAEKIILKAEGRKS